MIIEYKMSVQTPAGWRSVYAKATAEKISDKRCKVIEVIEFDGEKIGYGMSRTGAKRQQYNGNYFAAQETGKVKNLSTLWGIEE